MTDFLTPEFSEIDGRPIDARPADGTKQVRSERDGIDTERGAIAGPADRHKISITDARGRPIRS